jgi:predicted transcriptional regulator
VVAADAAAIAARPNDPESEHAVSDRREPGPLESAVMAVVAASTVPIAVADVQAQLPGPPAYTTVMTTLTRLAAKGALIQRRSGRAFTYTLAAPPESVRDAITARRMRQLLSGGSDRAGVLARFVAELDPDEERLLAHLLDRSRDEEVGER